MGPNLTNEQPSQRNAAIWKFKQAVHEDEMRCFVNLDRSSTSHTRLSAVYGGLCTSTWVFGARDLLQGRRFSKDPLINITVFKAKVNVDRRDVISTSDKDVEMTSFGRDVISTSDKDVEMTSFGRTFAQKSRKACKMSVYEERVEEKPACEMSVCEKKEQDTPVDTHRAASPGFSCVSMKSNNSMFQPPNLSDVDTHRAASPGFSCVSMKSNNSMFQPPNLSDVDTHRAASPGFSCVSMKSNNSMFQPPNLSDVDTRRAASPGFSCVSMKSNNSMFQPPNLSNDPAVTSFPV
ncbi:hypothetical protein H4Q32_010553 [Labeo rohita]|uniref:Uncharacterized protein n=1 Tax=Labeo rohita TaxID=84645 RepID=A0ABQ8MUZ2_LABRO|nr:hypothetical protein H4Q32_010553 [Labeo rohita]